MTEISNKILLLFEIGIWSLFGIWNLLFGISYAIDFAIS